MSNELSQLINKNDINSMNKMHTISNLGIVDFITLYLFSNKLHMKFHIYKRSISDKEYAELLNKGNNFTFFEVFGPNTTFKKLFSEIKKSTTLSKKEISELLKNEMYGHKISKENKEIYFTLCISQEDIIE